MVLVTVAAVLAVYWRARTGGFLWDDDAHITANPTIVGPLGLREIWTTAAANYFPLTMTSFWLGHAWWGLASAPYHWVSIVFHVGSALLLWRALLRLAIPGAWLGAMLWALHPVQVESVAWICELKNTQSGFFYLLAILLFVRWLQRPGPLTVDSEYVLAIVAATAAILSKTSTVMLPVVLGLVAWWLGRRRWRDVAWLIPFGAISAAAGGWTIWEQRVHSMASGADWSQTPAERLIIAGKAIWFYLGKLAWPEPLIFIYPRWGLDALRWTQWLPLAATAVAAALLLRSAAGRAKPLFFAGAYFVVSLFPVLGFFNVFFFRYSFVSDHFQYLASMGPLAFAGAVVAGGGENWNRFTPAWRWATGGVLLIALGSLASRQTAIYHDQETLWRSTVAQNPDAWIARMNLGAQYASSGRPAEAIPHYDAALRLRPDDPLAEVNYGVALLQLNRPADAISHLERALSLKPDLPEGHSTLGLAFTSTGRLQDALHEFETAARLKPDSPVINFNFGLALMQVGRFQDALSRMETAIRLAPGTSVYLDGMGRALLAAGRLQEAAGRFGEATKINPGDFEAWNSLATISLQTGRYDEAVSFAKTALANAPNAIEPRVTLARALLFSGHAADAVPHFEQVLRSRPPDADTEENLGSALYQTGRTGDAVPHYRDAVKLKPASATYHQNLASALMQAGQPADAIVEYQQALQLQPDMVDARLNLARVFAATGRRDEAVRQCEELLKLRPDYQPAREFLQHLR
jgi:protein O-mannosyl-transferase